MTKEQAQTLANFAGKAMPKSSAEQCTVLRAAIEQYPEEAVADAIVAHAGESEFISTVAILARVRLKLGGSAMQRMEREAREAQERYAKLAKIKCDPSVAQAQLFCRELDPEQLATYRAEMEASYPVLAPVWRNKDTLALTGLTCLIYGKYGTIPRECWMEGATA